MKYKNIKYYGVLKKDDRISYPCCITTDFDKAKKSVDPEYSILVEMTVTKVYQSNGVTEIEN